ncbi:MAG TPA: ATP-binding protein [Burkholderiaceae bacterium]|nr:ATP-binding protein [Burkholderiaceae bacterium]
MLSLRRRLTLIHLAVVVPVLAAAAWSGYWSLSRAAHGQLDAALLALAEAEAGVLLQNPTQPPRVHEVAPGPLPPSFVRLDRLVQILDAQGAVLARSANLGSAQLPATAALVARVAAGETVFETLQGYGEEPVRRVSVAVQGDGATRIVQVAGSLDDVNHVVDSAGLLFLALAVALLLAVVPAGLLLTRRAFGAIDGVVRQARRIGDGSLHERLPHPGTHDEIGRLVDTLNEMLARLEHTFEAQRRFTADASHELRSPLSRLRTELEVTLRRPRDAAEYVDALRSGLEEVARLTRLVEELLVLARVDSGQQPRPAESVALDRLVDDAVRRLQGTARERQVQLVAEPSPAIEASIGRGAADLVLANLLDNALKFSPTGGRIAVRVAVEERDAVVSVSDEGPGIAANDLPHLFDRFFRGSAARAHGAPGVGLGLAVSRAMVEASGGRIAAANLPGGGAVFTVRVPLASGESRVASSAAGSPA